MEWGQVKYFKIWNEKEKGKRAEPEFSKQHWKVGGLQSLFWEFWSFSVFVIPKSIHRLNKISITKVYIRHAVKKNNSKAMAIAINEACIEWLNQNFLRGKRTNIWLLSRILFSFPGFSTKDWKKTGKIHTLRGH